MIIYLQSLRSSYIIFEIAITDTGFGYSSLLMLAEIRPTYIKIDIENIEDIDKNIVKKIKEMNYKNKFLRYKYSF